MLLEIGSRLRINRPSPKIIQWCNENLVLRNPEYDRKLRMGFWTGNTPRDLTLYETSGDDLIVPFGCLKPILNNITCACGYAELFKPLRRVEYGGRIPLYDYQQQAVDAMIRAGNGILQAPAGSGKTQMGLAIASKLKAKTLWLTHTKDLLNQSKSRAEQYFLKESIGTITEGKVNIGSTITFATVQTMCKLDLPRYEHEWDCIIVDECHRVSGAPTSVTRFYKVLNSLCARYKFGLSATVHRSDGLIKATFALLGDVAYTVPDEVVSERTMRVGVCPIGTGVEISRECLNTDGTINYAGLINYLVENEKRNRIIDLQLISDSKYSSLILSERLAHLNILVNGLSPALQKDACIIHGKSDKAQREQALEDMRTGKKKYLFATYALAKEGLDIPCLERLYMATPQSDYAVVVQSIGRIARACEGKADPICYDFVDNMSYAVRKYKQRLSHYKKAGAYLCK